MDWIGCFILSHPFTSFHILSHPFTMLCDIVPLCSIRVGNDWQESQKPCKITGFPSRVQPAIDSPLSVKQLLDQYGLRLASSGWGTWFGFIALREYSHMVSQVPYGTLPTSHWDVLSPSWYQSYRSYHHRVAAYPPIVYFFRFFLWQKIHLLSTFHRIGWWENWNRKALYLMVKTMVSGFDFPD